MALIGDPERVAAEMLERGVQPDLLACGLQAEAFIERGAKVLPAAMAMCNSLVVTWSVSQDAAQWLPRVDAIALEALEDVSDPRAKWIRLAPRYLQKSLSHERYVRMGAEELLRFVEMLQQRTQSGEIAVPVKVSERRLSGGSAGRFLGRCVNCRPYFFQSSTGFRGAEEQVFDRKTFAEFGLRLDAGVAGEAVSLGSYDEDAAVEGPEKVNELSIAFLRRDVAVDETETER